MNCRHEKNGGSKREEFYFFDLMTYKLILID